MYLKELTGKEFSDFAKNFPLKSIYQTAEYAFVMNNQGYNSIFLGLIDNDQVIAATSINIRPDHGFKYAYSPRGFLINYEDNKLLSIFTSQIKNYLNSKGIIALKINPIVVKTVCDFHNQELIPNPKFNQIFSNFSKLGFVHLGYNNFFEALKPRFEAIIDLSKPVPQLFKNIKKEYRTKIRSAINNGVEIYKGNNNELHYLYEQTKSRYPRNLKYFQDCYEYFSNSNMIDYFYTKINTAIYLKNIQNKLDEYEQKSSDLNNEIINKAKNNPQKLINKKINIDKYLEKYRNELVIATNLLRDHPEGIITSTILVVKNNNEVFILIDGHETQYKRFNSKHLLIWSLIEKYAKMGFIKFNLGGLSNVIIDTKTFTGLNEFKLNFGAIAFEYIGDLELVTNKMNYNIYRNYIPLRKFIVSKFGK